MIVPRPNVRFEWGPIRLGRRTGRRDNGRDISGDLRGNGSAVLQQAGKFSAVGLLNTAIDAALYLVLTHWLGLGGVKILAKALSYSAGTINSFVWNRSWTFNSRDRVLVTFPPFALSSLLALGINAGAMYLGLRLFGQRELLALAMATGITMLWNFSVSKLLVFRR